MHGCAQRKTVSCAEIFQITRNGFNDGLVLTHPEWIVKIHEKYIKAGADCIETNTFGSNKIKLDEYGFGERTVEINKKAVSLALEAVKNTQKNCYVIGSMGPSGYLPSSNDPDSWTDSTLEDTHSI